MFMTLCVCELEAVTTKLCWILRKCPFCSDVTNEPGCQSCTNNQR